MHIIFGSISKWQILLIRILNHLKFKVFYIYVEAKSDVERDRIATKIKSYNIYPLPIEFEKKISGKSFSLFTGDVNEVGYKKNLKIAPDAILKKYCSLFSINEIKLKRLRLVIQDFISSQQRSISGKLGVWSNLYPSKKIIYVSFKFTCFYTYYLIIVGRILYTE